VRRFGFSYLNQDHQTGVRNKPNHRAIIQYYQDSGLDEQTFFKCAALRLTRNNDVHADLMGEWAPNFDQAIANVNNSAFQQYAPQLQGLLNRMNEINNGNNK